MSEEMTATQKFGSASAILTEALEDHRSERRAWEAALFEVSDAVFWARYDPSVEDPEKRGIIERVNAAAETLVGPGLLSQDGKPRSILDIIPEKWKAGHLAAFNGDDAGERSYLGQWHHDFEVLMTSGRTKPISLLVLKLRNGSDRRYIAIMRERKNG